ncbi:MAG: hypothetical protein V4795_14230 [Pseudomonadota bacterium]
MIRRSALGLGLLVLLPALGLAALLGASALVGRTPAELLAHAEGQAQAVPPLGPLVAPALGALRQAFADDAAGGISLPFSVPRLPANPAAAASAPVVATADPATAAAVAGGGRRIQVGPGRSIQTVAGAAAIARDGDTIEIDPGDYLADVAVWQQAALTIRGMGARVRLIANGASAEGKATWVVRGGRITVEGIDFIGSRVADQNGAGIRFEAGHLVVRRCLFFDNQNGILASPNPESVLEVEQSEFGHNGAGDGQTHHLYANQIRQLVVTGSYFHHANVGHLIKSRAARSLITYNRLSDETGGRASYELEFPNGGAAVVLGNLVQQGSQTSNSVMLSYGAEGYRWPLNQLRVAHNTLVNDHPHGGTFVRAMPGAELVLMLDNLLVGRGGLDLPDDAVRQRNHRLDWSAFAQAAREDYRLVPAARAELPALPVAEIDADLLPRQEYRHPAGLRALDGPTRFPGAVQSPAP